MSIYQLSTKSNNSPSIMPKHTNQFQQQKRIKEIEARTPGTIEVTTADGITILNSEIPYRAFVKKTPNGWKFLTLPKLSPIHLTISPTMTPEHKTTLPSHSQSAPTQIKHIPTFDQFLEEFRKNQQQALFLAETNPPQPQPIPSSPATTVPLETAPPLSPSTKPSFSQPPENPAPPLIATTPPSSPQTTPKTTIAELRNQLAAQILELRNKGASFISLLSLEQTSEFPTNLQEKMDSIHAHFQDIVLKCKERQQMPEMMKIQAETLKTAQASILKWLDQLFKLLNNPSNSEKRNNLVGSIQNIITTLENSFSKKSSGPALMSTKEKLENYKATLSRWICPIQAEPPITHPISHNRHLFLPPQEHADLIPDEIDKTLAILFKKLCVLATKLFALHTATLVNEAKTTSKAILDARNAFDSLLGIITRVKTKACTNKQAMDIQTIVEQTKNLLPAALDAILAPQKTPINHNTYLVYKEFASYLLATIKQNPAFPFPEDVIIKHQQQFDHWTAQMDHQFGLEATAAPSASQ